MRIVLNLQESPNRSLKRVVCVAECFSVCAISIQRSGALFIRKASASHDHGAPMRVPLKLLDYYDNIVSTDNRRGLNWTPVRTRDR